MHIYEHYLKEYNEIGWEEHVKSLRFVEPEGNGKNRIGADKHDALEPVGSTISNDTLADDDGKEHRD